MLQLSGITKRFPGVLSLDAVDFDVAAGEVHALVGENGAGKSTLIKIIAGAYQPDGGTITFAGERRAWPSPQAARAAGIHVIYQELVLFPELSVAENVMFGAAPRNRLGLIDHYIDFLGVPSHARASLIAANIWRGIPFVAICLLAGLQTISPSLYEAAMIDGASAWQRFWHITLPMLMPILAVVLTFSVPFTFTDFQLVYAITRGGPVNSTHLMATLAFQRAIPGGQLGEGAAIAVAMIPFLVFATCFSYFALARRKWQQGEGND